MRVKRVELTEDDPIFQQGIIISNQSHRQAENQKSEFKRNKPEVKKNQSNPQKKKEKEGSKKSLFNSTNGLFPLSGDYPWSIKPPHTFVSLPL